MPNKTCIVCGKAIGGEYIVARIHEGRPAGSRNRWRTVGVVHERCDPLLEAMMAHECPDCGSRCHCGGDIDDILFPSIKYESQCDHCDKSDWEYEEFINEPDDDCCPRCGGSGEVPTESFESYTGNNYKPCPECGGRG